MEDFDKKNQVGQVYLTISELMRKLRDQKLKVANKLHCQVGHASPEKLKNLIKTSEKLKNLIKASEKLKNI